MPPAPRSLFERVGEHICFPLDPDQCWPWVGACSAKKRGGRRPVIQEAGRGSRILQVARVILTFYQGPAPTPDHEAGHTCPAGENELCVNPRHLQWMTRIENEQYKSRRQEMVAEQSATVFVPGVTHDIDGNEWPGGQKALRLARGAA